MLMKQRKKSIENFEKYRKLEKVSKTLKSIENLKKYRKLYESKVRTFFPSKHNVTH